MKFEPNNKLMAGFNYVSFAAIILVIIVFVFISVLMIQKPSEVKPQLKTNTEVAKKIQEPQKAEIEQPKVETKKEEAKTAPVTTEQPIDKKAVKNNVGVEFELDFEGLAIRKIKSYLVPEYDGLERNEQPCKLNFSIKADGSVVKIYPVTRTNTKLELKSIFAMREWRFEPLKKSADQVDQPAIITFLPH